MGYNITFLALMISVFFLLTGGVYSAYAGVEPGADIVAGPNPPVEPPFTEIFVNDGLDFFVTNQPIPGDPNSNQYTVEFDENAETWLKHFTLCTPNGNDCDPHTVEAGQDITITELIEVAGDTPFTDWHEEIINTEDWEWVDSVTVDIFYPNEDTDFLDSVDDFDNIIIEDGTKLWIFFDQPLPEGTEITIVKEIENISEGDIAGDTIEIIQYPSAENILMGPGIWGIKYSDDNGNGIQDEDEEGIQGITICIQGEGLGIGGPAALLGFTLIQKAFAGIGGGDFCTETDVDGSFHFEDLPNGQYLVYEFPNQNLVNTTPMQINVELTDENPSVIIEFGNQLPPPIPGDVNIMGLSNFKINGMDVVYWQRAIMIEKNVAIAHCPTGTPFAVKVVMGPFAETPQFPPVEVMMTNTVDEIWKATIPPVFPAHGVAPIKFYVDCPDENGNPSGDTPNFPEDINNIAFEDEIQLAGSVYIDPSGIIKDACTGNPIAGATVTVQQSPDDISFVNSLASTPPLLPPINPQVTLADGHYGWVVQAGQFYRVQVTHPAYQSQTSASQFVGMPAVFNFDLLPNGVSSIDECPVNTQVGGEFIPISTTALILAGVHSTASWLIPVLVSAIGIGIVLVSKKSK